VWPWGGLGGSHQEKNGPQTVRWGWKGDVLFKKKWVLATGGGVFKTEKRKALIRAAGLKAWKHRGLVAKSQNGGGQDGCGEQKKGKNTGAKRWLEGDFGGGGGGLYHGPWGGGGKKLGRGTKAGPLLSQKMKGRAGPTATSVGEGGGGWKNSVSTGKEKNKAEKRVKPGKGGVLRSKLRGGPEGLRGKAPGKCGWKPNPLTESALPGGEKNQCGRCCRQKKKEGEISLRSWVAKGFKNSASKVNRCRKKNWQKRFFWGGKGGGGRGFEGGVLP